MSDATQGSSPMPTDIKRNSFGDAYCKTVDEARREIEDNEYGWEVYMSEVSDAEPPNFGYTAEILTNETGELVCYLEAPTADAVRALARELKL
jgi:hypothetical protein